MADLNYLSEMSIISSLKTANLRIDLAHWTLHNAHDKFNWINRFLRKINLFCNNSLCSFFQIEFKKEGGGTQSTKSALAHVV